jgi:hypothetical protein
MPSKGKKVVYMIYYNIKQWIKSKEHVLYAKRYEIEGMRSVSTRETIPSEEEKEANKPIHVNVAVLKNLDPT